MGWEGGSLGECEQEGYGRQEKEGCMCRSFNWVGSRTNGLVKTSFNLC